MKGQKGLKSRTLGILPAIPREIVQNIANSLVTLEKWGFGLSKKEVLEIIGAYVKGNNLKTPFKNGIPGKRSMDPFIISDYFKLLKLDLENIPTTQKNNVNEISFCLDSPRVKVVGKKGTAAHRATSDPGREIITVLMGANAAGEKLTPQIVYKGKNLWDSWIPAQEDEFQGMTYAAAANGWMEAATFQQYFTNIFLKHIGSERPVLLIYDGHSSHVGLSLVEAAKANGVVEVTATFYLSVFKPLKLLWDEELIKWQR